MNIEFTAEGKSFGNIFLRILGFFLGYIRNSLFLTSAMMILMIIVITQIFIQDELNIDLFGRVLIFLDNIPIITNYISINEKMHVDKADLDNFLLQLSLIFTIFTEAVYYFKLYVLKIEPRKTGWADLKRRTLFIFAALTFMHISAFSYIAWQTGDMFGGIFGFVVFWVISVGASSLFLLFDSLTKAVRRIKM